MMTKALFKGSLILLCSALFTIGASAKQENIQIISSPVGFSLIDKTKTRFDKLIYRGGLELSSPNKHFGGISGIVMNADGKKFMMVSDRGRWFSGDLIYKDGLINGLESVKYGRLTDTNGRNLRGKDNKDSESITTWQTGKLTGDVIVAYERKEKLYIYKTRNNKIIPGATKIPLPSDIKNGPHNKELETVVRFHDGNLKDNILIFSENHRDALKNIKGWFLNKKKTTPVSLRAWGRFYVTDAAILPGNDLLILERALSPLTGLSMQIRLIRAKDIKPGAILDGTILLQASQLLMIDNMEGISVHKDAKNRLIISLISDDNFSQYQRTLLLQFEFPKHLLSTHQ